MLAKMTAGGTLSDIDRMAEKALTTRKVCGEMENYIVRLAKNFFSGSKTLSHARRSFYDYKG